MLERTNPLAVSTLFSMRFLLFYITDTEVHHLDR